MSPTHPIECVFHILLRRVVYGFGETNCCLCLGETRWTARYAAIYVRTGDVKGFRCAVAMLADQSEQRSRMGVVCRERFFIY